MTKPKVIQFEIDDQVNEVLSICIDRDADPGVLSFTLDQMGAANYLYVTLDGLRALVAAAEQLKEEAK